MSLFNSLAVSATGMSANRLWLDIIANNISNVNSTNPNGKAYKRKMPIFAEVLKDVDKEMNATLASFEFGEEPIEKQGNGVRTYKILEDNSPFKFVYNPGHPHANKDGFVSMPNVDVIKEMVDMIAANRAYDASVQTANAAKAMINKALEIGK
jgi:flagellar basal-body rod protein FlgC